jgi:DNA-binding NarL/FixJ family response regulator
VKEYLYHIFRKLNVTSRTELALRSLRDGSADRTLA